MIIDNLEVIDTIWFDIKLIMPFKTIGIVSVRDTITKKVKMYIGLSCGYSLKEDIRMVVQNGVPFSDTIVEWIQKQKGHKDAGTDN